MVNKYANCIKLEETTEKKILSLSIHEHGVYILISLFFVSLSNDL